MKAPKELPTLPGIGGDGTLYVGFDTPSCFWNSKHIEGLKVRGIVLDEEDKGASTSNKIVPKAVSQSSCHCTAALGSSVGRFSTCMCMVDSL